MEDLRVQIEQIAQPFLDEISVTLVDLNIRRYRKSLTIEILADKPCGGITVEECAYLNRKIADELEARNLIREHYLLEVSSPGLDRPLKIAGDFLRAQDRKVRVFLSEPIAGKTELCGRVKNVENENLILEKESQDIIIPLANITKGQHVIG